MLLTGISANPGFFLFNPRFLELNDLTPLFLAGAPAGMDGMLPFDGKAGREGLARRLARLAFFV